MENSFDSMLNVSAVPQDDRVAAFIAESKNNRNRCYELSEQITAEVATDSKAFRQYLDVQSRFDRYTANNALLIMAQRPDAVSLVQPLSSRAFLIACPNAVKSQVSVGLSIFNHSFILYRSVTSC